LFNSKPLIDLKIAVNSNAWTIFVHYLTNTHFLLTNPPFSPTKPVFDSDLFCYFWDEQQGNRKFKSPGNVNLTN